MSSKSKEKCVTCKDEIIEKFLIFRAISLLPWNLQRIFSRIYTFLFFLLNYFFCCNRDSAPDMIECFCAS